MPASTSTPAERARVGDVVDLVLEEIAQGGHCVARLDGQVVFVRDGLPGERVRARLTSVGARFARAAVTEVLVASADRVVPPCPVAGRCGGCDFQHVAPAAQRELKRRVVAGQLQHLAGLTWDGVVEEVPPVLGWRTRMRYHATPEGRAGLRGHRTHDIVPLPAEGCRIAAPGIARPPDGFTGEMLAADTAAGPFFVAEGDPVPVVLEEANGRRWGVGAAGFWQSHLGAPRVLVEAVRAGVAPREGERALDLYCGVGLFAGALATAGCEVTGIEGSKQAVAHARRNVPEARFLAGSVAALLRRERLTADIVVLDPPRAGAGPDVIEAIAALEPRVVGYVSCDPATLARDLAAAGRHGYRVASLRCFDLFPMTHHAECLAVLEPR